MEMFHKMIVLIGIVAMVHLACDKNDKKDSPPIDSSKLNECFRSSHWDNEKIKDALIGKWEWEYAVCGFSQGGGSDVKDEEVEIEFRTDSTLVVQEHGWIIHTYRFV